MAECNRQNTESIVQIIEKIDNKLLVLPDFQRDFVWDESKTYELFDSLVRDIFIGSIIYGVPSFEIAVREIDSRPRKVKGKRRQQLNTIVYSEEEIKEILETLSQTEEYGIILRAKGILQDKEGKWFCFDMVPGEYEIRKENADYTGRLCVIGTKLNEEGLKNLFSGC